MGRFQWIPRLWAGGERGNPAKVKVAYRLLDSGVTLSMAAVGEGVHSVV